MGKELNLHTLKRQIHVGLNEVVPNEFKSGLVECSQSIVLQIQVEQLVEAGVQVQLRDQVILQVQVQQVGQLAQGAWAEHFDQIRTQVQVSEVPAVDECCWT